MLSALFAMQPLPAGAVTLRSSHNRHALGLRSPGSDARRASFHGASVGTRPTRCSVDRADQSSYDKREVLLELIKANAVGADARNSLLTVAAGVSSDYDRRVIAGRLREGLRRRSSERRAVLRRGESQQIGLRPRGGAGRGAQSETARHVSASGVRGRSRGPQVDVRPESSSGRIGEVGALNQTVSTRISASGAGR